MRKLTIILLFCLAPCAHAFKFPWDALKPEMNLMKLDIAKQADAVVKAQVDVGQNMKALAALDLKVGNISAQVDAKVEAKMTAYDASHKTAMTAGGNIQNNDSELIKFIFGKWYLFLGAFLAFFGTLVAQYERLLTAKDAQIRRLMDSEEKKDTKSDDWFRKYLESVTGHKTNGLTPGQQEAKDVLDETIKEGEVKQ